MQVPPSTYSTAISGTSPTLHMHVYKSPTVHESYPVGGAVSRVCRENTPPPGVLVTWGRSACARHVLGILMAISVSHSPCRPRKPKFNVLMFLSAAVSTRATLGHTQINSSSCAVIEFHNETPFPTYVRSRQPPYVILTFDQLSLSRSRPRRGVRWRKYTYSRAQASCRLEVVVKNTSESLQYKT